MTLIDRALDAHGGLGAWSAREALELRFRAGGLAFASKLRGLRPLPWHARVDLRRPRTVLEGYPAAGRRGILEGGAVRVEDTGGRRLAERADARAAFRSSPRRLVRWDDLDLLYFAAYAIWGYATFPFHLTLPGVEVEQRGERTLRVRYPADWPVHSHVQLFELDESGLLARNDYTAEVMGRWAHAVNVCEAHESFDGLVLPTRRRVHPRGPGGRPVRAVTLVRIEIDEVRAT